MDIKLVALDMDGTLLNDEWGISDYTKEVIREAEKKGITIVLATGRPLDMCYSYAKELDLSSYLITANGAEIWTMNQQLIKQQTLDVKNTEKLWRIGKEKKLRMWVVAAEESFIDGERPDNFDDYSWLKVGYGNLDDKTKREILVQLEDMSQIEVTNSSFTNIEVNGEGVNKLAAIDTVSQLLEIERNEIMAIGDSLNDLKMIEAVGMGVAVQNAQQIILDAANYITTSNNEDGVGKAIEKFVL